MQELKAALTQINTACTAVKTGMLVDVFKNSYPHSTLLDHPSGTAHTRCIACPQNLAGSDTAR